MKAHEKAVKVDERCSLTAWSFWPNPAKPSCSRRCWPPPDTCGPQGEALS